MKKVLLLGIAFGFTLLSCEKKETLQKYFVENSEKKEFIAFDLASDLFNTQKMELSADEKKALTSFKKANVIAFKVDSTNQNQFETERNKVRDLLKDDTYQELIKVDQGKEGGAIYFVGDDEHIDEFVIFANKKENGFAVVRILGDDMNPTDVMNIIRLMQKGNLNLEQLKPLEALVKP